MTSSVGQSTRHHLLGRSSMWSSTRCSCGGKGKMMSGSLEGFANGPQLGNKQSINSSRPSQQHHDPLFLSVFMCDLGSALTAGSWIRD
jgi:hypothetical protein